jgi:rfaE bifunctional protein kinase chain/domain
MSSLLVVGDAILDRYLYGVATRLSPEAPVPVMRVTGQINQAGGACNVALNANALGVTTRLLSIVGQDDAARELVAALNFQLSRFQIHQARIKTTVKTRHIVGNQHLLRIDDEEPCSSSELSDTLRYLAAYAEDADWIIFSDYGKHFQSRAQEIIDIARNAGRPIAVDPKSDDWEIYRGATLITPNTAELERAGGDARELLRKYSIKEALVTEGSQGMTHHSARRKASIHRDAIAQDVIDVTGAGDTALAAFVVGRARGWKTEGCMDFANTAAGMVCGMMGTHVASDIPKPKDTIAA